MSFTTPALSQARIRRSQRDTLEVLVPDFADSGGTYVMPWKLLPETISLTLHDRQLYDLITSKPSINPWELRRLQAEVGASGLAGPEVSEACEQALREDDRQRWAANFALVRKVFDYVGLESRQIVASKFLTPETQAAVKRAFATFAARIGSRSSECYAAIAEQSTCLAPVGLVDDEHPGRLRRILGEVQSMALSIDGWAAMANRQLSAKARAIGQVAGETAHVAEHALNYVDGQTADIAAFVMRWPTESKEIRDMIARLYWLLDGWEHIAATWFVGLKGSEIAAIEALHEILRIVPCVPRMECEDFQFTHDSLVNTLGSRRIKAMEDWRTRRMDFELVRRLEAVKAVAP